MVVDYPGAIGMFVDRSRVFIDANPRFAIVIHKTANGGPGSAEQVAQDFQTREDKASTHYIVGQDGHVVQCVLEMDGAGGNCCVEKGYDTFWRPFVSIDGGMDVNLNWITLSIEHFDPSNDNSTPLTPIQQEASFKLIKYLCDKYKIAPDHIKSHASIDPLSRARCPGNYPWEALMQYLAPNPGPPSAEALVTWDSFLIAQNRPVARQNTGIFARWWNDWKLHGYVYGPAVSQERDGQDFQGNALKVQDFMHARIEWTIATGQARVFDGRGEIL